MGIKNDRHTDLINWVCSTFDVKFSGYLAQVHRYDKYRPEPRVKLEDGRLKTPDVIAVNPERNIALIIDCKGGLDKQMKEKFHAEIDVEKIRQRIKDYSTILHNSLEKYFPELSESEMDVVIVNTILEVSSPSGHHITIDVPVEQSSNLNQKDRSIFVNADLINKVLWNFDKQRNIKLNIDESLPAIELIYEEDGLLYVRALFSIIDRPFNSIM